MEQKKPENICIGRAAIIGIVNWETHTLIQSSSTEDLN